MKFPTKTGNRLLSGMVLILALSGFSGFAQAKSSTGTISGVVLDPSGTPQMGATVWLISEDAGGRTISQILTNQNGAFSGERLRPGKYSVRVSLAGFFPTLERHISVVADITTMLRVQVDTIFASLDRLRGNPVTTAEAGDWQWVLRSSAATRTILQWRDGNTVMVSNSASDTSPASRPRGRVELTSGSLRPDSLSNLSHSPETAMSYDQPLGAAGRILFAGQMSYDGGSSGAFATVWLPTGGIAQGPETVLAMRRSKIGLDGLTLQGVRFDHSEKLSLGDRLTLRAGAEFVRVQVVSATSAIHPHVQLDANLSPNWQATGIVTANPSDVQFRDAIALQSAIAELDSLPSVLFRNRLPVLESGWHQEVSVKRKLTDQTSVTIAGFHDSAHHQTITGSGLATGEDFFQDAFSNGFRYDGGASDSWGTRVGYRQKISDAVEFATLYSWAATLSPFQELTSTASDLRDSLTTRYHHSIAARVSGKLPRTGTQLAASYKWTSGTSVTRQDKFGEAAYQLEPNLHLSIHQPLPGFGLGGRWEALADFSNLLAQGYVPINGQEPRVVLVPVPRSFRGGVSLQF